MVREVWLVKTERRFFFHTKPNVFAYVRCAHGHSVKVRALERFSPGIRTCAASLGKRPLWWPDLLF